MRTRGCGFWMRVHRIKRALVHSVSVLVAIHASGYQEEQMRFRNGLLATAILTIPVAAAALTPKAPISGIYLGDAGCFNNKTNPNVNNVTNNISGAGGLTTPFLNLSAGIGGTADGRMGYAV